MGKMAVTDFFLVSTLFSTLGSTLSSTQVQCQESQISQKGAAARTSASPSPEANVSVGSKEMSVARLLSVDEILSSLASCAGCSGADENTCDGSRGSCRTYGACSFGLEDLCRVLELIILAEERCRFGAVLY